MIKTGIAGLWVVGFLIWVWLIFGNGIAVSFEDDGDEGIEYYTSEDVIDEFYDQEPDEERTEPVQLEKHMIEPGEEFQAGSYIYFEDVEILYNGEAFEVRNDRSDYIRIFVYIVGVKADGTYELIQSQALSGVDEVQYEQDMAENGWAIEHITNLVRPGETLIAELEVFDFAAFGDEYPEADIDGDGYYDMIFSISPQSSETSITVSTSDPESEVYKLKAD